MTNRVDVYPTRTINGYGVRVGKPLPFGASAVPGGINFSLYSHNATACTLVLFQPNQKEPFAEIPFPPEFRIGDVYCMTVFGIDSETTEYGYRLEGPFIPAAGHRFKPQRVVVDPYAKSLRGRDVWGASPDEKLNYPYHGIVILEDFDWENDAQLKIPAEDLVIYEMHLRGFTRHPSAKVQHPGTFAGLVEKIPYLKKLGVNCVELLPICEFDEFENDRHDPTNNHRLYNYWGYSSVGFFAPKAGYAATGKHGMQFDEFKQLVKQLHKAGIEVILDVVFNHTAEGDERGRTLSFRGIDNQTYYMLRPDGTYHNFSGCGNTMNCNNPVVREMVLDCLRYWVAEYHIDGFRFDAAAILGRNPYGEPLANPPLLESLAYDPVLAKCKLIAEAWDAGGLYQVGHFPAYGRWAEWNGKYRDDLRRFLKSDPGMVPLMMQRIKGSPDLYSANNRGPTASINFITCHDGFTLNDLFSYNTKHNEANGENNNDGHNDNQSWNCGVEGLTDDPQVLGLRSRLMKNAVTILLTSQGVPMLLMGDEVARTQRGNNNAYCHDSEVNWLNWAAMENREDLLRFFKNMIAFRNNHPVLRNHNFLQEKDLKNSGRPDLSWHGTRAWIPDTTYHSRTLAFMLCGDHAKNNPDNTIYVAMNSYWEPLAFELPQPPANLSWHLAVNTAAASPNDIYIEDEEPRLDDQRSFRLEGRSVIVLLAK